MPKAKLMKAVKKVLLRIEHIELSEGETRDWPFPESPLSHKNSSPPKERVHENELPPPALRRAREPRQDRQIYINRLTTRQVLLENTYKCHKRTGTHYQYTRIFVRSRTDLDDEFLKSPRFVRRIWRVDSDVPRPKWIDHEAFAPFSISTYSLNHALESEVRLCQDYYVHLKENRAVARKLLTWAAAVVPPTVHSTRDEACSLWPAQTPPRCSGNGRARRARGERIHQRM
ncbi:hypothetical protein C8R47DRAFT_1169716 [Mycena vitilis]|nr:hypothetical protein C8R47DRAFT_1169716 [Mycena vitilis]